MRTNRFIFKTLSTFILFLFFIKPDVALSKAASGVFMIVKGDVKLLSKGVTSPAKVGQRVNEGDSILTGPDSRAKIVMSDKNVLNISPDSKMEITIYKNDESKESRKVELKVDYGKVRAGVEQKYDDDKNTFQIKTPTAVAGVRGTDFSVGFNRNSGKTEIVTFKGLVAFGKANNVGKLENPVLVRPGEKTELLPGQAPQPPQSLPPQELATQNIETVADTKDINNSNSNNQNLTAENPTENKETSNKNESNNSSTGNEKSQESNSSPVATSPQSTSDDKSKSPEAGSQNNPNSTIATPGNSPNEPTGSANKNNAPNSGAENNTNQRSPSSAPANLISAPSMIDAKDMAPETAKSIVTRPPGSTPLMPPRTPPPLAPPPQTIVNEIIRNQISSGKTKINIELRK